MSDVLGAPVPEDSSPSVNELFQELPPLVARALVYILLGLLASAGIFSFFGRLDELVIARAAVVPRGLARPVQSMTGGRVTRLAVQEGDLVRRDQVLVYLETDTAQAQLDRARQEQELRQRQLESLLAGQADGFQIAEARARLAQAQAEEVAARRLLDSALLLAPMDGQVTRLAVRGVGEAVQPGQTVAEVAPADAPLVFEASVANNDIGRVKMGQRAKIKVDAFPHQSHGTLDGTVQFIAPDTAAADQPGYRVIIAPLPRETRRSERPIELRLGLTGTAEIVTERRRIIDLLLRTIRGED